MILHSTVSVGLWVDQGSKDESDQTSGISHLIEHLLFNNAPEGADQHPLATALQARGGRANATTTKEFTYYHVTLLSVYLSLACEALAAIVRCTAVPADDGDGCPRRAPLRPPCTSARSP